MSAKSTAGPGGKKPASVATNLIGKWFSNVITRMMADALQLVVELA
jgi:hypothetical protein